jgi:hypothetical protein
MNRKLRLAALACIAVSAIGLSGGAAHALAPAGPTDFTPPIQVDPCVIQPLLCDPPPGVTTTTTMPTTPTTVGEPTTTTVPPDHPTGDPVPPAHPAPVVHASPNFTG